MIIIELDRSKPLILLHDELCQTFTQSYRTEDFWFGILTQYIQNCTVLRCRPLLLRKLASPDILAWYDAYVNATKDFVDEKHLLNKLYEEFTMNDKVEEFIDRNRFRFEDIVDEGFERKLFRILYRDLHDIAVATFDRMTTVLCYFDEPLTEKNYDMLLSIME